MRGTPLSAADFVTNEVRRQIWAGEVRGGDRLNQADLADQLGVSRIPVREALIGLERDGLIEILPRRGARVVSLSESDVRDHYELYGLIDGFALEKMLERSEPSPRDAFQHLISQIPDTTDPQKLQQLMTEARTIMHREGGSPRFTAVASGLRGLVDGNFFEQIPGAIHTAHRGYAAVAKALANDDTEAAVTAYRSMMADQATGAITMMTSRGLLEA